MSAFQLARAQALADKAAKAAGLSVLTSLNAI
jgi:hypothetical protein